MTDSATRPPRPDQARRAALLRHESTTRPPRPLPPRIERRLGIAERMRHDNEWAHSYWTDIRAMERREAEAAALPEASPDAGLREALQQMVDRWSPQSRNPALDNARAILAAHRSSEPSPAFEHGGCSTCQMEPGWYSRVGAAPAPDRGRQLVEDVHADRIRGSWDEPPFGAPAPDPRATVKGRGTYPGGWPIPGPDGRPAPAGPAVPEILDLELLARSQEEHRREIRADEHSEPCTPNCLPRIMYFYEQNRQARLRWAEEDQL